MRDVQKQGLGHGGYSMEREGKEEASGRLIIWDKVRHAPFLGRMWIYQAVHLCAD